MALASMESPALTKSLPEEAVVAAEATEAVNAEVAEAREAAAEATEVAAVERDAKDLKVKDVRDLKVALVVETVLKVLAAARDAEDPDPRVALAVVIEDPELRATRRDPEPRVVLVVALAVAIEDPDLPETRVPRVLKMLQSSVREERDPITGNTASRARRERTIIPSTEETALAEAGVSPRGVTVRATGALLMKSSSKARRAQLPLRPQFLLRRARLRTLQRRRLSQQCLRSQGSQLKMTSTQRS